MRILRAFFFLVLTAGVTAIMGCGDNGGKDLNTEPSQVAEENAGAEEYPRLVRSSVGGDGEMEHSLGPLGGEKSLKFIEDYFGQLEWDEPGTDPSLQVQLSEGHSLEIKLPKNPDSEENAFVAVWTEPGPTLGGATTALVKQSDPLSREEAINLLRDFVQKNGDIESLAEWSE